MYVPKNWEYSSGNMDHLVHRVHFLRARARKNRWTEELLLVHHEMSWTVRHFRHQAMIWENRITEWEGRPGPIAYARRKLSVWSEMADVAEQQFRLINANYMTIIS